MQMIDDERLRLGWRYWQRRRKYVAMRSQPEDRFDGADDTDASDSLVTILAERLRGEWKCGESDKTNKNKRNSSHG